MGYWRERVAGKRGGMQLDVQVEVQRNGCWPGTGTHTDRHAREAGEPKGGAGRSAAQGASPRVWIQAAAGGQQRQMPTGGGPQGHQSASTLGGSWGRCGPGD